MKRSSAPCSVPLDDPLLLARAEALSQIYSRLRTQDALRDWLIDRSREECESPIEAMLLTALVLLFKDTRFHGCVPQIHLQYPVDTYRVDICILGANYQRTRDVLLAIECDGHDYHERTPEQAEHDRSRDRFLQAAGYSVLRYTGREILRNPFACAEEIIDFYSRCAELGSAA